MVAEPPCGEVGGYRESPSRKVTVRIVNPSASAATWVWEVSVPGPMSLVAASTTPVSSASRRAHACAG